MAIDDQLASLLAQNASLFATYEDWANGQVMLLAGTITDPDSFNAQGGKTGALGYYPVVNVSGQTIYVPCMDRLRHAAIDGVSDALEAVSIIGDGLLRSSGSINEELRLDVAAASVEETVAGTRSDVAVVPAGAKALVDRTVSAMAQLTGYALDLRPRADAVQSFSPAQKNTLLSNIGAADQETLAAALSKISQAKPQVSLLAGTSGIALNAEADLVQVAGAIKAGLGIMDFVYDPVVGAAYVAANPYTSFLDKSGRGYRLTTTVVHARMFGVAENDSGRAAYNAGRIQAAIDWCAKEVAEGRATGFKLSFEGMGVVYHGQFTLRQGVDLYGGRQAGRGGRRGCCTLIPTGIPDNQFAIITPSTSKIFHFGIHGFYIKGGGANSLFAGIFLDNCSDGFIDFTQLDDFGLQCIVQTSTTGVIQHFKNFAQGLKNTAAITVRSGSVEIAGADFTVDTCEYSGPSQYTVSGPNLLCAAVKCTGYDGSFINTIFQTGDVGISDLGTRTRFVGCRFDTNAAYGILALSGTGCTFSGGSWVRNSYASIGSGSDIVGSIDGNVLTVTALARNQLSVGDTIIVPGGINCVITGFGTGAGGLGMYGVDVSQQVAAGTAMTGRTLYDHIRVPVGGASRLHMVGPHFDENGVPYRYAINDASNSVSFRNTFKHPTWGSPGTAAMFSIPNGGRSDIVVAAGTPQPLPVSATPSVLGISNFYTQASVATAITAFVDCAPGQRITVLPNDNFTSFVHGPRLLLAQGSGSIKPASGSGPLEFIERNGVVRQIGGEGLVAANTALARLTPVEAAAYDFGPYDVARAAGLAIGTDTDGDGRSDGITSEPYGTGTGIQSTTTVSGGIQYLEVTFPSGVTANNGRRLTAQPANVVGNVYFVVARLSGSTANTRFEVVRDGTTIVSGNPLTDANGAAAVGGRYTAPSTNPKIGVGLPAFGGAVPGTFKNGLKNLLVYDLTAIEAATGFPATQQTDAVLLALFLKLVDRAPKVKGFTAGTGTANKGAFATTNPMTILSATAPAAYSQSFTQSDRDALTAQLQAMHNAIVALSQRNLAQEQALRTAGVIN